MTWLRQHAWWAMLVVSLIAALFGVNDIAFGAKADVLIPQALTGQTIEELEREGPGAYRMFDFATRSNGWTLVILGTLLSVIVAIPFRRGQRWAWWTLWVLPLWAGVVPIFYLVAGVQADQPPPPPMISGPIVAVLWAAILLVIGPATRTREYEVDAHQPESHRRHPLADDRDR